MSRFSYGERMTEALKKTMNDAQSKVVKRRHYPIDVMLVRAR